MDHKKIIRDALVHHGFTPAGADALIANYDAAMLTHSDHSAYRELADEINNVLSSVTDPGNWDGDHLSEIEMLKIFVTWLPDMIRHRELDQVRKYTRRMWGEDGADLAAKLADVLDPFEPNGAGLRRKTTGEPVPWPVVADTEQE